MVFIKVNILVIEDKLYSTLIFLDTLICLCFYSFISKLFFFLSELIPLLFHCCTLDRRQRTLFPV